MIRWPFIPCFFSILDHRYDFRSRQICPAKISFRPDKTQQVFQLVGSNDAVCDENGHWEVLCEDNSFSLEPFPDRLSCHVGREDINTCSMFRCVGIKVLKFEGRLNYVSIGGIHLWSRAVQKNSGPPPQPSGLADPGH